MKKKVEGQSSFNPAETNAHHRRNRGVLPQWGLIWSLGLLFILGYTHPAGAVNHSLNLAVGSGHEESVTFDLFMRQDYGAWLDRPSYQIRPFTTVGVTAWIKDSGDEENVWGILASFGLELRYLGETFRPYVSVNVGPSLVTEKRFVGRDLGGHFLFNTRAMAGFRFGQDFRHNLGLHATHYSNAHLFDENDGFNTVGGFYGFSF